MAYRAIHTKIWRDTWFADLEPDSKLLFFYLCSNEATNVLGLYELSPKIAAFETGLGLEQVKLCLSEFRAAGKVDMENGWIWVKNLMRYNATNLASQDVQTHIRKTLALVPDGRLKTACTAYNTLPAPSIYPVETVPPPSPDGPTTVQYTVQDQDQNSTVQDQDTYTPQAAPECPPPEPETLLSRKKPREPVEIPAAVVAYRDIARLLPHRSTWPGIEQAVGPSPPDLDRWRGVVRAWIASGWNPKNVGGMLQFYADKRMPGTSGRGNGSGEAPEPKSFGVLKALAVEKGWIQEGDHV